MDIQNILTVDLEDWYQTEFRKSKIRISDWDKTESRLQYYILQVLELLRKFNTRATFFVLAYNAKRHSEIIHMIKNEGHELGLHGYYHNLVFRQTPSQFKQEIDYSKKLMEDTYQVEIKGFRAPNWSITHSCLWALDILKELGFSYDSSMSEYVFNNMHNRIPPGLLEIPRSELRFLNQSIPIAGGFYLRAYPYSFTRNWIKQRNKKGQRALVYIHPWEFNKGPFPIETIFIKRMIYNFRLRNTKDILYSLLQDFNFNSIQQIFL